MPKPHNPFAPPDEEIAPLELDHPLINSLRAKIKEELQRGKIEIPPLPKVAVELNRLCGSANADMNKAANIILRDPQIASRVLRVASSSAYGATTPVTDLRTAAVRIGLNGLRDIAFALSMAQVFRCGPLNHYLSTLTRHAFVVGCATYWIVGKLRMTEHDGFLCGLLHDVGKNVILGVLADAGKRDPAWMDPALVQNALKDLHAAVGGAVISSWKLPPAIKEVALWHHQPEQAKNVKHLVAVVALANAADHLATDDLDDLTAQISQLPLTHATQFDPRLHTGLAQVVLTARADAHLLNLTDTKQF